MQNWMFTNAPTAALESRRVTHSRAISTKLPKRVLRILTLKLALQAESIFPPGVSALYTKILTPVARLYQQKYLNTTAVTSYFLSKNCAVVFAKNTTTVTPNFPYKICAVVFEIISPVILTSNCAFLTTSPMSAPVWRARKWHTHNDIYPLP